MFDKELGKGIKSWLKGIETPVSETNKDGYISDESTGYYSGQSDRRIKIHSNGSPIGHMDYSVLDDENEPHIQMIYVDPNYRRKGYGTKMMQHLQKIYPNKTIHTGYTTDDGTPFIDKTTYTVDNPRYKYWNTRKNNIQKELSEIHKQWEEYWNNLEKKGIEIRTREQNDELQKRQYKLEKLLWKLEQNEPRNKYFRYVKE